MFAQYIMDPEVAVHGTAINLLLGMEPPACKHFVDRLREIAVTDPPASKPPPPRPPPPGKSAKTDTVSLNSWATELVGRVGRRRSPGDAALTERDKA
eukprot:15446339-Alexandrium_andersonii.AAC.1